MEHNRNNADMIQLLHRGLGELLYDGPEGTVLRQKNLGTVITDITCGEQLLQVLRRLQLPHLTQLTVKSEEAFAALRSAYGFQGSCPCAQWVYEKEAVPPVPQADIRLLTEAYLSTAADHYTLVPDSSGYLQERIAAGQLWGLFEGERLAGFIGLHSEGAMGMLEILPEFRRRGYGYALESFLIRWQLEQGWQPYCHVVQGNEASTRLQKKLGLELCSQPALWID